MRALIVTNERKNIAARVRSGLAQRSVRVEAVDTVGAAIRAHERKEYSAIVLIVPPKWESVVTDVETLRLTNLPVCLCVEEDLPLAEEHLIAHGIVETIPAAVDDEELSRRLIQFVTRHNEFYQSYDEASRAGSSNPGYVPMDDESTCWYCLEQGKASIEHRNFSSARGWLQLLLRVRPEDREVQTLSELCTRFDTESGV